jgi:integrase
MSSEELPRYLFRRGGMIYVKLQPPGGKLVEKSLGTPDVHVAKDRARDLIAQHERFMYQRRQARVACVVHGPWIHEHAPGLHTLPEGGHVLATETTLTFTDKGGKITGTRPNGGPAIYLTGAPLSAMQEFKALDDAWSGAIGPGPVPTDRPSLVVKDADAELFEVYISHAGLNAARAKECRDLWHLFKTTTGKTLKDATRDDGRKLVAAMGDVKSATAKRKLVPLRAAVNLAISEGKHTGINPFVSVVAKRSDSTRRKSFDDSDMKIIRANLGRLSKHDQLLVRTLACTGMRLSEAFSFDGEQTESGVRFIVVAEEGKTLQSFRRLPLPKILLPHLPKVIKGKLFEGKPNAASTRLGEWLREIGITDPAKVAAHSYRHRAKDELRKDHPRVGRCPPDIAEEIFGREKVTMGDGYGNGSPVPLLKKWIDRIDGL